MHWVQLGPYASTFLVVFYVLTSLILVVLLGAAVFLVLKLNALLEKYERKIDPLLAKADIVLTVTTEKVNSIGTKAEEILNQGEELTEMVHTRVDTTTSVVQRTVFTPLISVNSLLAGIKQGTRTFANRQQKTIKDAILSDTETGIDTVGNANSHSEDSSEWTPDRKNFAKISQSPNIMPPVSVNTMVNNGAEPQIVTVGARKENS
jgi:predicted PurR-regulated permease PerM